MWVAPRRRSPSLSAAGAPPDTPAARPESTAATRADRRTPAPRDGWSSLAKTSNRPRSPTRAGTPTRSRTMALSRTTERSSGRAEPWWNNDATTHNGFYWLTILDAQPRPHNNTWIHHHRKVVLDSDNNYPPWMEMFDGNGFALNGEHPIMMFALDGRGAGTEM